jgi:MSHA biogenesis protein MshQ
MEFSNRGSFVNCGTEPEFDFRDGMTVAAWIKVREFNKRSQAIVTKGDAGWRLQRLRESGMVEFCFNTAASGEGSEKHLVSVASKRKVDDGQWHHVVGLSDGHRAALYVDGELEASADAKPIVQNTAPLMIGCNPPPSFGKRFEGWIDDVRLYGYGLGEAEVKALYQGAGPVLRAEK